MEDLTPKYTEAKPLPHPENFDGDVKIQTLVPGDGRRDLEVLAVFFKNGARTRPHAHPVDQLLVVIEGRCVVATKTDRIEIEASQSAFTPAGEWHWHGAVKDANMCHLSIKRPGPTDWNQPLHNFYDAHR